MKNYRALSAQQLNYFAIELLELLGNNSPNQEQIDLLEALLITATTECQFPPNQSFTEQEIKQLYLITSNKISEVLVKKLSIDLSASRQKNS